MSQSKLFHPSSRPSGHGITIGGPRIYDLSAAVLIGASKAVRDLSIVMAGQSPAPEPHTDIYECLNGSDPEGAPPTPNSPS